MRVRNGHLYVVHLLLKYNADPNRLDAQSFNTLHLAVHSSSAFLLLYILFTSQPIAIDSVDTEGHTALHWACYQGDAFSVDLLIRAGADPRKADNAGLTALHWAAVKGNSACIQHVAEAGVDVTAREGQGKTAKDMAIELKSIASYKRGLADAGFDEDGRPERPPMKPRNATITIMALPTLVFLLIFTTLSVLPWWSGLLLSFAELFAMHHVVTKVVLNIRHSYDQDRLQKSPYLCGIIIASIIWVIYVWATRFVPSEFPDGCDTRCMQTNNCFWKTLLATQYSTYAAQFPCCFVLTTFSVPSRSTLALFPKPQAMSSSNWYFSFLSRWAGLMRCEQTIEELTDAGMLNGMAFCLNCLVNLTRLDYKVDKLTEGADSTTAALKTLVEYETMCCTL